MLFDVVIVGGGPAGLSAALLLGRSNRKVLIIDSGKYRNEAEEFMHSYLTRDHTPPTEFRKIAREEVQKYGVKIVNDTVNNIIKIEDGTKFKIITEKEQHLTRKVILATGLKDIFPKLEGLEKFFGKTVHHCPYCAGHAQNNKILGVHIGHEFAMFLKIWSDNIILFSDGQKLSEKIKSKLATQNISFYENKIIRLQGEGTQISSVLLDDGQEISIEFMFLKFKRGQEQRSKLAEMLGLEVTKENGIKVGKHGKTKIKGIYAIGDATKDVLQVGVAVAEGIQAGIKLNKELFEDGAIPFRI